MLNRRRIISRLFSNRATQTVILSEGVRGGRQVFSQRHRTAYGMELIPKFLVRMI
jgi:hypothetical protein